MIGPRLATGLWTLGNRGRWRRFRHALHEPGDVQRRLLRGYLRQGAGTVYGQRHRFAEIDSVEAWQRRLPLVVYDDLEPLIKRVRSGEPGVLTAEPVTRLVPSSGSTAARKLVPYTAGLACEHQRAIGPWIVDLHRRRPGLRRGRAYWSISPAVEASGAEPSAVPVGFDDDGAYLGAFHRRLVESTLAVPGAVRHLGGVEACRYATLVHLLRARDLTLISVWHPSFLTLLLEPLARRFAELVADVAAGTLSLPAEIAPGLRRALTGGLRPDRRRAAELEHLGPGDPPALWPRLEVISCWADGHAAAPAAALAEAFPGVDVEPKGLIATEAFVSLPFIGTQPFTGKPPFAGARPAAVRSHFFEFLADDGRTLLLDELADGGEYSLVVTTAGGLYRYRLQDRVLVEGRLAATPCLRFLAREDSVSDRAGEKLSEGHVASVFERLLAPQELGLRFAMLAPDEESGRAGYTLYLESRRPPSAGLAARVEAALAENPHYRYCAELGQLAPLRLFRVAGDAHHVYLEHCRRAGRRLGDVKPTALSVEDGWSARFEGRYEHVETRE